jgi:hypothetical protein
VSSAMLLTMLMVFAAAMYGWHNVAIWIVASYGIDGTAIVCGVIYATARVMDRFRCHSAA